MTEPLTLLSGADRGEADDVVRDAPVTRREDAAARSTTPAAEAAAPDRATDDDAFGPKLALSDRDAEILRRSLGGKSAAEIGEAMGCSKSTALRHVRRVRNTAEEREPEPVLL